MISLLDLDPADYRPHPLHAEGREYNEFNCYVDVLIELVTALGHPPEAMLGSAVAIDFETDQWTFYKPWPEELLELYGVDIHEMQPYRRLPEMIEGRLLSGHSVMVEMDSFHLPDTASTSYHREHVKSSVLAEAIDREGEVLRYFHNGGYHELSGADYRAVFGLDVEPDPSRLPPYAELVRPRLQPPLEGEAMRAAAEQILRTWSARRASDNPFARFEAHLHRTLPALLAGDLAGFHSYAFATVRMAGSSFALLAAHLRWLYDGSAEATASELDALVTGVKALSFRLARRREFDIAAAVSPLAGHWDRAMSGVDALLAR